MKVLALVAFFMIAMGLSLSAQARQCTVTFKSCQIKTPWGCVKWKKKKKTVNARNSVAACQKIRRQYKKTKNCRATCVGRVRGLRWEMRRRGGNGATIQGFGRGPSAKQACRSELRRRQCRQRRNRQASCVGLRRGRIQDSFGPLRCNRRRR